MLRGRLRTIAGLPCGFDSRGGSWVEKSASPSVGNRFLPYIMSGRGDDLDWVSACLITANSSHSAYPPQVNGPGAQGTGIDVSVDARAWCPEGPCRRPPPADRADGLLPHDARIRIKKTWPVSAGHSMRIADVSASPRASSFDRPVTRYPKH